MVTAWWFAFGGVCGHRRIVARRRAILEGRLDRTAHAAVAWSSLGCFSSFATGIQYTFGVDPHAPQSGGGTYIKPGVSSRWGGNVEK